ncbi:MAG: L-threonylcarbamoyladenylate synthase [Cyanobacteria bacterium P01_A01_bin.45]
MQVSLDALIAGAIAGKVVSFPTDTLPALAVIPKLGTSIFDIKKRSYQKPLILMAANTSQLWDYIIGSNDELEIWQEMTQKYLPGALTLVLPASEKVPACMNPLNPQTIGIRVPNSAIARKILAETGPLATTSANLSGQPPLMSTIEINKQFPNVLTLATTEFVDEEVNIGIPSTVIEWNDHKWAILRQGSVKIDLK